MSGAVIKTHGLSHTREYNIWAGIKSRCYDKNSNMYYLYGAKGIKMCDSWVNSFENFLKDMGLAPTDKHTMDRFPNKIGSYEKDNCRWATQKEQQNNRTDNVNITLDGVTKTMSQWGELVGIHVRTIHARIKYGWSLEDSIKTKLYAKRQLTSNINTGV